MSAGFAVGTYRCRDVVRSVTTALGMGVTWIDTAANYASGTAEEALRPILAAQPGVRVSTKIGFVPRGDRQAARRAGVLPYDTVPHHCLTGSYIGWRIARSRASLGRAPDLVFVHNPEHDRTDRADLSRVLTEAFAELEAAAVARRIGGYGVATWTGLSSGAFTIAELMALAKTIGGPTHHLRAVQLPVSLVHLAVVAEALDGRGPLAQAREAGLAVFASAPLGGGEVLGAMTEELTKVVAPGATSAQAALSIALSAPGVSHVLLSASTRAHWSGALGATAFVPLSPSRLRKVIDVVGT